jgi:hypothetical protein
MNKFRRWLTTSTLGLGLFKAYMYVSGKADERNIIIKQRLRDIAES